jgi:hypothetical protein
VSLLAADVLYDGRKIMRELACFLCIMTVVSLIGCQRPNTPPEAEPVTTSVQSQETRVLTLAREYLDKEILGTPGGSAKWNLKARMVENRWIVEIPDEIQATMPGGFPDRVIVDLEKNLVTTREPKE